MENRDLEESNVLFCINGQVFKQLIDGIYFEQLKNEASGKELVLFLGLAGSGKSACINYLLGANLLIVKTPGGKRHVALELPQAEGGIKYAEIGTNNYQPHTLHAEIYRDAASNCYYCDTPALFNSTITRCAEEVYGSFSAQLAVHSAESIKAVVLVIDWNIFSTTTATELKNLLYALSLIFPDPDSVSSSLVFLINKAPKDITFRDFHETVLMFQVSQNKKRQLLNKNNSAENDNELARLINEIKIINLIENKCREWPQSVIILDVFDEGQSRSEFKKVLSKLQRPIPKKAFNFKKYNKNRELFEREARDNSNVITNNIISELISESYAVNNSKNSEKIFLEVQSKKDRSNLLVFINILLRIISVSLGVSGFLASIIGVCAVLNCSFAISVVEKLFHAVASYSTGYMIIYGLIGMLASCLLHKAGYLLVGAPYTNDSTVREDDSRSSLVSNFPNNRPFIEEFSFFKEESNHSPENHTNNLELKGPEP